MTYLTLIDGPSAAIVLGGTVLGTVLRSGWRNSLVAMRALACSLRPGFDAEHARSELAVQIQDIHRNGLLRAEPRHFGDAEFDEVSDTLIARRSIAPLLERHRAHKKMRQARSHAAVAFFNQASELGPVFGLAGTLIALSQLSTKTAPGTMLSSSIPMAIVTTFYGLIIAHLLFAPIAHLIERRADKEERERQKLIDWLAAEMEQETARPGAPSERMAA